MIVAEGVGDGGCQEADHKEKESDASGSGATTTTATAAVEEEAYRGIATAAANTSRREMKL